MIEAQSLYPRLLDYLQIRAVSLNTFVTDRDAVIVAKDQPIGWSGRRGKNQIYRGIHCHSITQTDVSFFREIKFDA
jgi:hypothetical protein